MRNFVDRYTGAGGGGGAFGDPLVSARVCALTAAVLALLIAGAHTTLSIAAMLMQVGDTDVRDGMASGLWLAYGVPIAQYGLFAAAAVAVRRHGARAVLLGGVAILLLGVFSGGLAPAFVLPAAVGVGGALVLAAAAETLLLHRGGRGWWLLALVMYVVGLWGGWGVAPTVGRAGTVWVLVVMAPVAVLLLNAHALPGRAEGPRVGLNGWAVAQWSGAAVALGLVVVDPGYGWATAAVVALISCVWRHRGKAIILARAVGVAGVVGFGIWITVTALQALLEATPLEQLSLWSLFACMGAGLLAAAAVSPLQISMLLPAPLGSGRWEEK